MACGKDILHPVLMEQKASPLPFGRISTNHGAKRRKRKMSKMYICLQGHRCQQIMPGFFKLLSLKTKEIHVKDVLPAGHKAHGEGTCIIGPVSRSPPMHSVVRVPVFL